MFASAKMATFCINAEVLRCGIILAGWHLLSFAATEIRMDRWKLKRLETVRDEWVYAT